MIEKSDMDFENRIVAPEATSDERGDDVDYSLRPKALCEYIGQEKVKENLWCLLRRQSKGEIRLITFCFTALRDLEKQLFPG